MTARRGAAALGAALVAGLTLAVWAASPDLGALDLQAYEAPKPAPAFSLPDLAGHTRNLEELRGKVVLLFFGRRGDPTAGRSCLPSTGSTRSSGIAASRSCS